MRKDSRLSRVLHALVHLNAIGTPVTSDDMAKMLNTNPVVVRRTMALLREAGYVNAAKGHHGGWTLSLPLANITLLDVHKALGENTLFTIGLTDEHQSCPIEQAVNQSLAEVMNAAEQLMLQRFGEITLDQLAIGVPSVKAHATP
ncbi:RrF2 family transcriptional regulator [Pokkaliibacter sp. CJK22405]|uniref:RrF2 family transcriptional regulator n=1 Tax=Pokkaliibacter sp. CJK22405 TaxID=3384615 RepID=UPI003984D45F